MREAVIVGAARTPVGSFGGSLKNTSAVTLGSIVIRETLKRLELRPTVSEEVKSFEPDAVKNLGMIELEQKSYDYPDSFKSIEIDEIIMGNVIGAGQGQNVARQSSIYAGIPKEVNAFTVNKVCGSGMKALALAALAIRYGEKNTIIAGGMENMSMVTYGLPAARWGAKMGNAELVDLMIFDGLWEIFYGYHMGITAENIAEKYGISRAEQDEFGAMSHARALKAIGEGKFKQEIVPLTIPQGKAEPIVFDTDERPMDTNAEKMAKLRPAFKKDGTITAGNASGINDASAALLLTSDEMAKDLGLSPIVKIKAYASGAIDPAFMGLGPVPAVRKILRNTGLNISDFGQIELNEAFAAQSIACIRELGLDLNKTNLLGSGISIGHPIGCTGARIVLTLMNEMIRNDVELGLAALCIGGGQGMAMALERVC